MRTNGAFPKHMGKRPRRTATIWGPITLLLVGLLMAGGYLVGCGNGQGSQATPSRQEASQPDKGEDSLAFDASQAAAATKKQETVLVKADATGNVIGVTVSSVLKGTGSAPFVSDRSSLSDILNTQGNERFSQTGPYLLWENKGTDIAYEGNSAQQPPVGVKLTYYLDGAELSPQEIAGKSGEVTIRFDYSQPTGAQHPVYLFTTMVTLDHAHFSHIEVTNGSCSSMGDMELVSGYALPAFKSATGLSALEGSRAIDVPEYLEIHAQATDFQLGYTTTIVTTGLFKRLGSSALQEGADLVSAIQQLESSSTKILRGIVSLDQGADEFGSALEQYTDGARQIDQGANALAQGISSLESGGAGLTTGARQMADALAQLDATLDGVDTQSLEGLDEALKETLPKVKKLMEDVKATDFDTLEKQITEALDFFEPLVARLESISCQVKLSICVLESLHKDLEALKAEIAELKKQGVDTAVLEELLASATKELDDALAFLHAIDVSQLDIDLTSMRKSIQDIQSLLTQLEELVAPLESLPEFGDLIGQIQELKSAVSQLSNGASQLEEGMGAYASGLSALDKGAEDLQAGAHLLGGNGSTLTQGYENLAQGIKTLLASYRLFDEDGIQALSQLGSEEVAQVFTQMARLKALDEHPQSFSGVVDGTTPDVTYLIETAGVS